MSDEPKTQLQHLSAVGSGDASPLGGSASAGSAPECDALDEAEYVEALAAEIEALTNEAKTLLDRSLRLSARMKQLCRAQ